MTTTETVIVVTYANGASSAYRSPETMREWAADADPINAQAFRTMADMIDSAALSGSAGGFRFRVMRVR